MFKRKIKEEKIINGVKTEFNYEVSLLGNKELTHKWERSDDKRIVTYYDGHLIRNKSEYIYNDEEGLLRHGVSKYYCFGYLEYEGHFKNGELDGKYSQFHTDNFDQIYREFHYLNGELHGECKEYSSNGQLITVCTYENGKPIGIINEYYNNGKKKFEGDFVDGEPIGKHIYSNLSGYIMIKYSFKNGYKKFNKKVYYEDSESIKSVENFIDGEGTLKFQTVGANRTFVGPQYSDWRGFRLLHKNFPDGTLHGSCKYYSKNGQIIEEGSYENGKKVGMWSVNEELKSKYNDEDYDDVEF